MERERERVEVEMIERQRKVVEEEKNDEVCQLHEELRWERERCDRQDLGRRLEVATEVCGAESAGYYAPVSAGSRGCRG